MYALPKPQPRRSLPKLLDLLRVVLLDQLIVDNEQRVGRDAIRERRECHSRHCVSLTELQAARDRKIKDRKMNKVPD